MCYHEELCTNYDAFISKAESLFKEKVWIFRGQTKANWPLQTSLERAYKQFQINRKNDKTKIERNMLREFQRRLHQYTDVIPEDYYVDEWFALMQHYGAPTRLLDFTYSHYIASYFAFEHAESRSQVAIWAINTKSLSDKVNELHPDIYNEYEEYNQNRNIKKPIIRDILLQKKLNSKSGQYTVPRGNLILAINPFRLNERLASQIGVFLCPVNVTLGFMRNLNACIDNNNLKQYVIKYIIPTGDTNQNTIYALVKLDCMNISRTTLFPGLDGFARSFTPRIRPLFIHQNF